MPFCFYCVYKNLARMLDRVVAIVISPSQNPLSLSPSILLLYFQLKVRLYIVKDFLYWCKVKSVIFYLIFHKISLNHILYACSYRMWWTQVSLYIHSYIIHEILKKVKRLSNFVKKRLFANLNLFGCLLGNNVQAVL